MAGSRVRGFGLTARVTVYIAILAALFLFRGPLGIGRALRGGPGAADSPRALAIAGSDLAPALIPTLLAAYGRDYPELSIRVDGGGTAQALEALINRRADVAFLIRPPSTPEQDLFRAADGDTALWFPVALGGIALLTRAGAAPDTIDLAEVRALLAGAGGARVERLYVADPNSGLWDALRESLGIPAGPVPGGVVFLKDEGEVLAAVAADPGAVGAASTLVLPADLAPLGVRAAAVRAGSDAPTAEPGYEAIGYGEYPLFHHLIMACRSKGHIAGNMFVTYVTSDRGQRQVERAGFLPARQTLREVVLTQDPIGKTS